MAKNGISTLDTKEQRQIAKLDLAAIKRGESYNRDLLPTKYVGDTVVYNSHPNGLVPHRPWSAGGSPSSYPQRTNYAFDFVAPPSSGTIWNDNTNQVSATINGTATRTTNFGGGIVFNGTDTYLEIKDITSGVSNLTISMAADFESANGNWNVIYSGGNYGGNDIFAYISGGNQDSMSVGTGQTFNPPGAIVNYGLAWWDFVYNDTTVTVYKNGSQVLTGTLGTANTGFTQNLLVGLRYGSSGDLLNGTIYRIKCVLSALDSNAIITQYNSVASAYGLTPRAQYIGTSGFAAGIGLNFIELQSAGPPFNQNFPPPGDMTGWTVTGGGISGFATVTGNTQDLGGGQLHIPIDQTFLQQFGTYTFTAP